MPDQNQRPAPTMTRRQGHFGHPYVRTRTPIVGEAQIRTFEAMCRLAGRRPSALAHDIVRRAIHAAWSRREVLEAIAELALVRHTGEGPVCWLCGCVDTVACPGGCHWVSDPLMLGDLCSSCQGLALDLSGGIDAEAAQQSAAPAGAWPSPNPLTDPPQGFLAAGLNVYDSEDDESLFTFGHVSTERMVAAVADYVRHTQFPPGAVVDDPLAHLVGGARGVRAAIRYAYATYDPKPVGFCDFAAKVFVDPSTDGAWPITYWDGGDRLPDLPKVPYVVGHDGHSHAVDRDHALATLRDGRDVATAACGSKVIVTRRAFDRATLHRRNCPVCARRGADVWDSCPSFVACPECAWTAALAAGPEAIAVELDALTPTGRFLEALTRLVPDPLIGRRVCEAILAEARRSGSELAMDVPEATVQLLAAATRHAPMVLVSEDCGSGDHSVEHPDGGPCPATSACPACSLRAGGWAGQWEGQVRSECHIPAPCAVLTMLAGRFPPSPPTGDGTPAAETTGLA